MAKIALLFPGQGSQYVGMGKSLYENHAEARDVFEEASEVLGTDIKKLCFDGDLELLTRTENAQPAILTASVAAFRTYMKETGRVPDYTAGHSLGEYSALVCADSFDFPDCVRIVRERGRYMQEAAAGGDGVMLAISGLDRKVVEDGCLQMAEAGLPVFISNYNSPMQTVISGCRESVRKLGAVLEKKGASLVELKVSAAFHSPLMQNAAVRFAEELEKSEVKPAKWPVVSNVAALPYKGPLEILHHLKAQIISPVRWQDTMEFLRMQGVDSVVEIGPKTVLKKLAEKNIPGISAYSYDIPVDRQAFCRNISSEGHDEVNKGDSMHQVIKKCITEAVCTRNQNWDNDEYREGVILPYQRIRQMQADIEKGGRMPTTGEAVQALEILLSIFRTKKVPAGEQRNRLENILDSTGTRGMFSDIALIDVDDR